MPYTKKTNEQIELHSKILGAAGVNAVGAFLSSTLLNSTGFFKQSSPWKQAAQMAFAVVLILEGLNYMEDGRSSMMPKGNISTAKKVLDAMDRGLKYLEKTYGPAVPAMVIGSACNFLVYGMRSLVEDSDELLPSIAVGALSGTFFLGLFMGMYAYDTRKRSAEAKAEENNSSPRQKAHEF